MNIEFSELWRATGLYKLATWFDSVAKPSLAGLAIISSGTAAIGFASQFETLDLGIYLRCVALGLALWLIARTFWAGAWLLPAFETRQSLLIYAFVSIVGFTMFAAVSVVGSLSATGGAISRDLTQKQEINALENTGQLFARYIGELKVVQAGLSDRAAQAFDFERAEIAGDGPTGVAGRGSVSNSFGTSGRAYRQAVGLLGDTLDSADSYVRKLETAIAEARAVQIDPSLSAAERDARLKVLTGRAISAMRDLLALDPARSIRTAATTIAAGVPNQSRANALSQLRIAEINAGMQTYARQLEVEADRIAALVPELPEQTSLSPAEQLIQTMWRMPGLTMAALLLDVCGWIAIGFRIAIYRALRAKIAEENVSPVPGYVTQEDFWRVEEFVTRAEEAKRRVETARTHRGRGRPRGARRTTPPKTAATPSSKRSGARAK